MLNTNHELDELLALEPLVGSPISLLQFLRDLKDHPERAQTAAALLVRAVKTKGELSDKEIDELEQSSPERARYYRMLKSQAVPIYRAFLHVRGSHRTVARIMKFLEAGAQNGYQLRQLLVAVGGPGSGKSYLFEAFKEALEGEQVFVVKGCPVHENPVNMLKLLKPHQVKALAEKLGLDSLLPQLLKVAGKPCKHCWSQAMLAGDGKSPSLANIEVEPIRLSSEEAGIATWMPSGPGGESARLLDALKQGSRGMVDMPEMLSEPNQLIVLLSATEDRRIPSCVDPHEDEPAEDDAPQAKQPRKRAKRSRVASFMPSDSVLVGQTNPGAWKSFIKDQKDPSRFTRRTFILTVPYNTSVCEETEAYLDFLAVMTARPHIDPLALKLAAMLAVASRMKKESAEIALDIRMRMYNGENLAVPKTYSLREKESDRWTGGLYGSSAPKPATDSKLVSVTDLWTAAGDSEAADGLNMSLMLSIVSQVCELAMNAKDSKHQCITALGMLNYLRARVESELRTPELADGDKKILENCREFLKEIKYKSETPALTEREYRRLLRNQLVRAFAPDYEERAKKLFYIYKTHANAAARGVDKVADKRYKEPIEIEFEFLEGLERRMGKTTHTERTEFRQGLDTELNDNILIQIKELGAAAQEPSWRTLPALRSAISKKLDEEIAGDVERCLTDEMNLNSEDDRKLRRESLERFESLGYCQHCAKVALEYIKEFKLWTLQS